jgi:hypothetical protein
VTLENKNLTLLVFLIKILLTRESNPKKALKAPKAKSKK